MCYSAQVVQLARKLHRQFGLRIDYEEAERLFLRRLEDPAVNISPGFEANFDDPTDERGFRIKKAIDEHRSRTTTKLEREIFSQKTRLVSADRSLLHKETRKAREDVRIATRKIEALTEKLQELRRAEDTPKANRIFPMVHCGVIVRRDGQNILMPMRYTCRPAGKPSSYDKKFPGLYNARRDNLDRFWSGQFGHHHAIMVVDRFYENVALHSKEHRALAEGEKVQNVVLEFTPQPPQSMLIACLWSHWTDPNEPDLYGFAAITDEPPPAVAEAGHDRCIINLKPEHVDAWLTPEGREHSQLQAMLSDRAVSVYEHVELEAA